MQSPAKTSLCGFSEAACKQSIELWQQNGAHACAASVGATHPTAFVKPLVTARMI
jgi:hypothetical protein